MRSETKEARPEAVTYRETAARLRCSMMTVRRLVERGELTRIKLGRAVRVTEASIAALLSKGGAA